MKKVVFAAAVLAAIVSATGTASAVSSSVFPITAQEGFIRIAPERSPQAVRDALDKKYPGSFIEEAYNDATASLYKVIVKRSRRLVGHDHPRPKRASYGRHPKRRQPKEPRSEPPRA